MQTWRQSRINQKQTNKQKIKQKSQGSLIQTITEDWQKARTKQRSKQMTG